MIMCVVLKPTLHVCQINSETFVSSLHSSIGISAGHFFVYEVQALNFLSLEQGPQSCVPY